MDIPLKSSIWSQFGAAIDMLENAIVACPDALWGEHIQARDFWYVAYHALFWLDLYLFGAEEGFEPPAPFRLVEMDPPYELPDRVYTQAELQTYLQHCRAKCRTTIEALNDETAWRLCKFSWGEVSFVELLLYSMRHVQEHASQLSVILGQHTAAAPGWVGRTDPCTMS
jgi:hypothetical protein